MTGELKERMLGLVQRALARLGYQILSLTREEREYFRKSGVERAQLPPPLAQRLRADHPRLAELRRRYAAVDLPMAQASLWTEEYRRNDLALPAFRDDNVYVWQHRNVRNDVRRKYYMYLRYLMERDSHRLLNQLEEDGAFGCWAFRYEGHQPISRDLLDSINEICFLDRHCGLLARRGVRVLDIGAGYGRLAHRMLAAAPGVQRYVCVDAIPESTFLSEFYLEHRNCLSRASVVPLDELHTLRGNCIDIALNVHSFSEMPYAAIEGWLTLAADCGARELMIVPNDPHRLESFEADGQRRDLLPLLERLGFRLRLKEAVLADPAIRDFVRIYDHFFLLDRT